MVKEIPDDVIETSRWPEWFGIANEEDIPDGFAAFADPAAPGHSEAVACEAINSTLDFPDEISDEILQRTLDGLRVLGKVEGRLIDASGTWKIPVLTDPTDEISSAGRYIILGYETFNYAQSAVHFEQPQTV